MTFWNDKKMIFCGSRTKNFVEGNEKIFIKKKNPQTFAIKDSNSISQSSNFTVCFNAKLKFLILVVHWVKRV